MSIGWGGIIEDSHDVQVSGIGTVSVRSSQTRQARRMTAGILSDSLRLYPVKAVSSLHPRHRGGNPLERVNNSCDFLVLLVAIIVSRRIVGPGIGER
ncbi:hypothetical protein BDQ94DRAFT_132628 [Aspergillus welwitschiae]|uniref:Uncharacterized protein n=1 Tax=Aspergillus welwitschiae TaxID=1341132 RepID=A0A3F3QJM4_9EURO|nr:hypothetical protein BDQ94DRAFT_132628 [Aspergillus welwitschiae]RDH39200.1 hypothetical protein BDQ94DRAFT_132628 [Aspergillus welwitschiae]